MTHSTWKRTAREWGMRYVMRKMVFVLIVAMASGCATSATRLNRISLGMSKAQVIDTLGDPDSVGAVDRQEDLHYIMRMGTSQDTRRDFFVRLVDGKVSSYGKTGDYDSARDPARTLNLNVKNQ